jgi:hypothetical protein
VDGGVLGLHLRAGKPHRQTRRILFGRQRVLNGNCFSQTQSLLVVPKTCPPKVPVFKVTWLHLRLVTNI